MNYEKVSMKRYTKAAIRSLVNDQYKIIKDNCRNKSFNIIAEDSDHKIHFIKLVKPTAKGKFKEEKWPDQDKLEEDMIKWLKDNPDYFGHIFYDIMSFAALSENMVLCRHHKDALQHDLLRR